MKVNYNKNEIKKTKGKPTDQGTGCHSNVKSLSVSEYFLYLSCMNWQQTFQDQIHPGYIQRCTGQITVIFYLRDKGTESDNQLVGINSVEKEPLSPALKKVMGLDRRKDKAS